MTMKISHILAAAGLAAASLTLSTSADAQRWHSGDGWHDRGHDRDRYDRRWHDRGWHGGYRWRAGYRWHPRCWIEWRHHHRIRVCA